MLALVAIIVSHARSEEIKTNRHGYNCPEFPDSRCPEVVNVSAKGLWPPDDTPRADIAFMLRLFSACNMDGHDDARGVHWLSVRCEW